VKLVGIEIDRFGIWEDTRIGRFGPKLNVIFGPNEAGKTTIVAFIRSVLFGLDGDSRRYLDLRGDSPRGVAQRLYQGGSLHFLGPGGRMVLRRWWPTHQVKDDRLELLDPSGRPLNLEILELLRGPVSAELFGTVFSIDLSELQRLALLEDQEAASLLLDTSAGLGRVPIRQWMENLRRPQAELWEPGSDRGELLELFHQWRELRGQARKPIFAQKEAEKLAASRRRCDAELETWGRQIDDAESQLRRLEMALSAAPLWHELQEIDRALEGFGPVPELEPGLLEKLDELVNRTEPAHQSQRQTEERLRQLEDEYRTLPLPANYWQILPRVEAFLDESGGILEMERRTAEARREMDRSAHALRQAAERLLGPHAGAVERLLGLSPAILARCARRARRVILAAKRLTTIEERWAAQEQTIQVTHQKMAEALGAEDPKSLPDRIRQLGEEVAQLRKRVQLGQRLERLQELECSLQEDCHRWLEAQSLPMHILLGLGGIFIAGVVCVIAAVFLPQGTIGLWSWPLLAAGGIGLASAVIVKYLFELSAARRLVNCQHQLAQVQQQIADLERQIATMDQQLSQHAVPTAQALAQAEKELERLEALVPLEAEKDAAAAEAERLAEQAQAAQAKFNRIKALWQKVIGQAGLPEALQPEQFLEVYRELSILQELQHRERAATDQYEYHRGALEAATGRLNHLAELLGLNLVDTGSITERIQALKEHLQLLEDRRERRAELRTERRLTLRRLKKAKSTWRQAHRSLQRLLRQYNVASPQELRELVGRSVERANLLHSRQQRLGQLRNLLREEMSLEELGELLSTGGVESLRTRHEVLASELQAYRQQRENLLREKGRLDQQWENLLAEEKSSARSARLRVAEYLLRKAADRWYALDLALEALLQARNRCESHFQPECLQTASELLGELTAGRYRRVFAPMEGETLLLEDAASDVWPIEMLSQGLRDQLFITLRLALVSLFRKRGVELPLVLDDVLVNFDASRTAAGAELLVRFAESGQQILLFTCHSHIVRQFRRYEVPLIELPESPLPAEVHGNHKRRLIRPIRREKTRHSPTKPSPRVTRLQEFDADRSTVEESEPDGENQLFEEERELHSCPDLPEEQLVPERSESVILSLIPEPVETEVPVDPIAPPISALASDETAAPLRALSEQTAEDETPAPPGSIEAVQVNADWRDPQAQQFEQSLPDKPSLPTANASAPEVGNPQRIASDTLMDVSQPNPRKNEARNAPLFRVEYHGSYQASYDARGNRLGPSLPAVVPRDQYVD